MITITQTLNYIQIILINYFQINYIQITKID